MPGTKSYLAKTGQHKAKWHVVDATGKSVGRLASDVAMVLMGKHSPLYTPHVDTGDFVVVVNAEKVTLSGKKWNQKEYTWFTGYTGLRTQTAADRLAKSPTEVVSEAVRRMLPKNKLARHMLTKLKVYAGPNHPHQAQQPATREAGNRKGAKKTTKTK